MYSSWVQVPVAILWRKTFGESGAEMQLRLRYLCVILRQELFGGSLCLKVGFDFWGLDKSYDWKIVNLIL